MQTICTCTAPVKCRYLQWRIQINTQLLQVECPSCHPASGFQALKHKSRARLHAPSTVTNVDCGQMACPLRRRKLLQNADRKLLNSGDVRSVVVLIFILRPNFAVLIPVWSSAVLFNKHISHQPKNAVLVWLKGKKGKGSSLDIAPLTILDSGALQPRKLQLIDTGCTTAAQASGCP